jgi:hypothetical protein
MPAQNGTSSVLAGGKHARCRPAWATPRTVSTSQPIPTEVAGIGQAAEETDQLTYRM